MSSIKKTFVAVFFGRGIMALRQVIIVPILISHWGVDYYGKWLILSAIPSFMAMSNLGLGTSAATKIALNKGDDSVLKNKTTFSTAWIMILSILILVSISLLIWNSIKPFENQYLPHGLYVLLFLIFSLFVRMLAQPVNGWWVSQGKAAKSLQINNLYSIGELLIYLVIPATGGDALVLTGCALGWAVCWLVYYLLMSIKSGCPLIGIKGFCLTEAKALFSVGIGHQLSPLWQGILFQGSIMLAGTLFGSPGAALWGSLRIINRAGNQLLELVSQTVGPEFQRNYANSEQEANQKLHVQALLVSLLISVPMCIGLTLIGPYIFKYWTHGQFSEPRAIWYIIPASLVPFSLWWVSGELQRSLNAPWFLNIWGVIAAVASLAVMYSFSFLGISGLAIGALSFELIMMMAVLPRSMKLLNDSYGTFSKVWKEPFTAANKYFARSSKKLG